ncbi:MAG: alpha-ketoglutarate-dependent dioxygenase AlkB [Wenzhouxiangellaceae bacterium]
MSASGELAHPDLAIRFLPAAIDVALADQWLTILTTELAWTQQPITLFGKQVMQPRLTAWYGEPGITYRYSGLTLTAQPWTATLTTIRQTVEMLSGARFNSVLCNYYRDGSDSMGWHADDEPELGPEPVIASLSLGASRRFVFRRRDNHRQRQVMELSHGSLLMMTGTTQRRWQHALPKTQRVSGPRINLTFRTIFD